MQRHRLFTLIIASLLAAFVGWAVGPRLAALGLGSKYSGNSAQSFYAIVLQKDDRFKGIGDDFIPIGDVRTSFPQSMKTHTTEIVSVILKPIAQLEKPPTAHLESPGFQIVGKPTAVEENREYHWSWQISPETSGERIVSLWFDPDIKLTTINSPVVELDEGKRTLYARINVLTDLGLTTTQDAIAKALAALLGIIGTVTGYSFLRKRFEQQASPAEATGPRPSAEHRARRNRRR